MELFELFQSCSCENTLDEFVKIIYKKFHLYGKQKENEDLNMWKDVIVVLQDCSFREGFENNFQTC